MPTEVESSHIADCTSLVHDMEIESRSLELPWLAKLVRLLQVLAFPSVELSNPHRRDDVPKAPMAGLITNVSIPSGFRKTT